MRVYYGHRILRWWLDRKGYYIVTKDRWVNNSHLAFRYEAADRSNMELRVEKRSLEDRVKELEAEVEAHRRVEAALAERLLTETP